MDTMEVANKCVRFSVLVPALLIPSNIVAYAGIAFGKINTFFRWIFGAKSGSCVIAFEGADHAPIVELRTVKTGKKGLLERGGNAETGETALAGRILEAKTQLQSGCF